MRVLCTVAGLALIGGGAEAAPDSVLQWVRTATQGEAFTQLRRAKLARDQDDFQGVIEAAQPHAGALKPLAAMWVAEALAGQGDHAGALAVLAKAPVWPRGCEQPRHQGVEAQVELAAQLRARTDPVGAAEHLLTLPITGQRLVQAERWFKSAGRGDAAKALQARLLAHVPGTPQARSQAEALGPKGVAKLLKTTENRTQRMRNLLADHLNAEAAAEAKALLKVVPGDDPLSCELGYIQGKALRKMRRYRPAQRALEAARKRCARLKDTTFTLRVALLEARVRSIRGQVKGTRLLADWIQRRSPGHRYADDALFLHAEVLQRRGDTKGAHAAYERLIRQFPDADFGPTARWRLALAALLAGEKSAVRTHLDQILKDSSARPAERHRAQYWRARLALDAKDEAAAKAGFERLVLDPNFYGWLALDRLATQKPGWVKGWKSQLLALRDAANVPLAAEDLGPSR